MDPAVGNSPAMAATPMSTAPALQTPQSEDLKRKRQPRNSACQHCAQLKMKCIQQANGICERCHRMGRECVPSMPKPRKRRTQSGIAEADGPRIRTFPVAPPVGPPPRFDPPTVQKPDENILLTRHDISHTDSRSFVSLFSRGLGNATVCEELLNGIDYSFVSNSFTKFRQLTSHFPFVEIAPNADVLTKVACRPMLTLAVCTVASASRPDIQDRLSQAFLYALASKSVLTDDRSLDTFAGLLVFLAWHHHYLPQHQVYQKLCLLAGMATDLGLYRSYNFAAAGSALETDRAMVGAYHLCCGLSAKFDKANPLRWTKNLRSSAESVAQFGTLPIDCTFLGVLELAHAMDDLDDTLRQHGYQSAAKHFVNLSTKSALHRLDALKRDHPTLNGTLAFASATIRIHQQRLRHGDINDSSVLIETACAVKEYLDELLARPPSTLHQMGVVAWADFLEILVVMAHVSKPSQTAGWEAGAVSSMLQPDAILDSIYGLMASTPADDPLVLRSEALQRRLYDICQATNGRLSNQERNSSGADAAQRAAKTGFDLLDYFGAGVLDSGFWDELSRGT
ncbi:unnamed protein product [Zymoseptoria tritici ST99CH_3D7]|uniref:Zn(2)-C6 fungal-type domain-containing protein n=1 Tax=Zymoseptoria tritici (strain ST99CH_3D7) TaxID=1276538 RepID=A0A1X7RI52_ZYMT9|nr:unnamed protein product [Zymoseptoria tritici ST99CH_3D7]